MSTREQHPSNQLMFLLDKINNGCYIIEPVSSETYHFNYIHFNFFRKVFKVIQYIWKLWLGVMGYQLHNVFLYNQSTQQLQSTDLTSFIMIKNQPTKCGHVISPKWPSAICLWQKLVDFIDVVMCFCWQSQLRGSPIWQASYFLESITQAQYMKINLITYNIALHNCPCEDCVILW